MKDVMSALFFYTSVHCSIISVLGVYGDCSVITIVSIACGCVKIHRSYIMNFVLILILIFIFIHLHVHLDLASITMCAHACKELCAAARGVSRCSMSSSW